MDLKEKTKSSIIAIIKWIISNTIWTIITYALPLTLLIPTVNNLISNFTTHTFSIDSSNVFLLLLVIFLEIIIYIGTKYAKKHIIIENGTSDITENIPEKQEENDSPPIDYDSLDYYFESYHKHLTVYKNGNGILINSFTIVINDINSITQFKRELKIHDSKTNTNFPKLQQMKKTNLQDRFKNFGFWYKCLNNKDLIASVRESYWSDDSDRIDTIAQSDSKDLKWIMEMNPSSIEIGKAYNIVYIFSIPNMFPIENGIFNEATANIKGTHGKFCSQFAVKHVINKFTYTISFENGLNLHKKPTGHISSDEGKRNLHYDNDNNIIYDKYIFNTKTPKCNSFINIEWCFKENVSKKRRRNMKVKNDIERGD